ncbi:MAG: NUDIX hydrolase [Hyphomicrobiaceae bacterium]|nr:NUDIX hydrolase [Hyphomicrobiaceae bacterium]
MSESNSLAGAASRVELDAGSDVLPSVFWVSAVDIAVANHAWRFPIDNDAAVAAHWQRRQAANPALFNGTVHMLASAAIVGDVLTGRAFATEFRNFLFWRDGGSVDLSVWDAFGSAIILASDGGVLLARQRPGFINAGLYYLPGGFIDARDVSCRGRIDIVESVKREVAEETGLDECRLLHVPRFLITRNGPQLSIGVVWRSDLDSAVLRAEVMAYIASGRDDELDDVRVIHGDEDLDRLPLADYCKRLMPVLLQEAKGLVCA